MRNLTRNLTKTKQLRNRSMSADDPLVRTTDPSACAPLPLTRTTDPSACAPLPLTRTTDPSACAPASLPRTTDPSACALVSILIPVYNEEEFIQELLGRVLVAPLPEGLTRELIVVDDCSTDGSMAAIEEFIGVHPEAPIRVLRQARNQGKGAAIRTAIQAATGHYSIIQDADLEYDPREYPKMLRPLLNGEADVVYGSRFMAAGERRVLYFWHSLANRVLTTLCNIVADLNLTDMETCYKAFRTAFAKTIPIEI